MEVMTLAEGHLILVTCLLSGAAVIRCNHGHVYRRPGVAKHTTPRMGQASPQDQKTLSGREKDAYGSQKDHGPRRRFPSHVGEA